MKRQSVARELMPLNIAELLRNFLVETKTHNSQMIRRAILYTCAAD